MLSKTISYSLDSSSLSIYLIASIRPFKFIKSEYSVFDIYEMKNNYTY